MTTDAGETIDGRVGKTRMPYRVAAVLLGLLFLTYALFQLLGGAEDWADFGFAIFAALMGLQFLYSAWTGQWKSLFEWFSDGGVRQINERFLMVEPVSCGTATIETDRRLPNHDVNPYAPPSDFEAASIAEQVQAMSSEGATPQLLTEHFLSGYPFIHYGVVFFLDPDDDASIHAALPLSAPDDRLVRRNAEEAIRVLPEFLGTLPGARSAIIGRELMVRMISSYDRLDEEVSQRIVIPWSTTLSFNDEF
ncbi:hypothetical protein Enr13x_76890 [Stieleria neptunia]|uniref:Uncharacterized protein n=1 Tax=Stieleria neptunia TaxID=2527979 RepID=A0A518I406_9BACT|nr:hypothetical protein [Stieleria neptunia]QDV47777.1 hypothetical protein Enr13x_76890 [Stieleria neptunia]